MPQIRFQEVCRPAPRLCSILITTAIWIWRKSPLSRKCGFSETNGKFTDVTQTAGDLNKALKYRVYGIVAGDFDNDNFADLLVFGDGQTMLFRNNGKGGFQNVTSRRKFRASSIFNFRRVR
jgi:hypothetical protein